MCGDGDQGRSSIREGPERPRRGLCARCARAHVSRRLLAAAEGSARDRPLDSSALSTGVEPALGDKNVGKTAPLESRMICQVQTEEVSGTERKGSEREVGREGGREGIVWR